jgi:hypothetical protein
MEKFEQGVVIKFLWMKRPGTRNISTKLSRVLGDDCYSPAVIERWFARFREGDLSCAGHSRSGRPMIDISECLRAFFDKFPFANANMMSRHFRIVRGTIMKILQRNLGLKKSPADRCHISSAHRKKLIMATVLELYCTCCPRYNRSISRE